jgi:holo-[acyl-carrier protein] synthase
MIRLFQGIDLVSISKLQKVMARHAAFLEDVFTPGERAHCQTRVHPQVHLAARFAVKEACLKAMGQGLNPNGIDRVLRDIELTSRPSGQPRLVLHGWAARLARKKHIIQQTVSVSHSADFAIAIVLLVGSEDP